MEQNSLAALSLAIKALRALDDDLRNNSICEKCGKPKAGLVFGLRPPKPEDNIQFCQCKPEATK